MNVSPALLAAALAAATLTALPREIHAQTLPPIYITATTPVPTVETAPVAAPPDPDRYDVDPAVSFRRGIGVSYVLATLAVCGGIALAFDSLGHLGSPGGANNLEVAAWLTLGGLVGLVGTSVFYGASPRSWQEQRPTAPRVAWTVQPVAGGALVGMGMTF